jgi:LacI family transcriptional regulator
MSNPNAKKNVRLQDIAGSMNLSASTVSRALAGNQVINEDTRKAVQRAAISMGYIAPPQGARRRRTATRTVGVLVSVSELHNRFMTLLLEYIHHDMLEFGYHVMILIDPMNSETDATHLSTFRPLIDGHLDGMILGSATADSVIVRELKRLGVPMVLVVRSVDGMQVDIIEADNAHGGAEIMKHFYELGHRRIGLVMGPENASTSRDRAQGALRYLRGIGVPEEATPVMWNAFTSDAGYSCAVQMLSEPNPVTAIMAGSDSIALGVLDAARVKGFDVPSQLSVAGFDDVPLSGSRLISLTTVHNPVKEMARTACRRMVERIRTGGLTPPTRDVMPTELIRRDTSAPPGRR